MCIFPWGQPAQGEPLREALAKAYATNPTLAAQGELVEAAEEDIPIARSGALPQVHSRVGVNHDLISTYPKGGGLSGSVEVGMPFYDGGRVSNRVRSAKALHRAQQASLRAVEGDILTETVAAYVGVLLARAIADLQENQVSVLKETLTATRLVFRAGDLSLTDVAQAEARLALARSDLATARSRLRHAEENYRRMVGNAPGALQEPPPLAALPASAEAAERIALQNSPELGAAVEEARSAGFLVSAVQAERLPLLSGVAIGNYNNHSGSSNRQFVVGIPDAQSSLGVGLSVSIPLFQGGSVSARVRQAKARQRQWNEQLSAIERQVVARARAAFASYSASQEAIRSNEVAVASNEVALEGSRVEFRVGTRILLDVLNAEQELLNSRVALLSAHRDAHVASFSLLNAMGLATARELSLDSRFGVGAGSWLGPSATTTTAAAMRERAEAEPAARAAPAIARPQTPAERVRTDDYTAGTQADAAAGGASSAPGARMQQVSPALPKAPVTETAAALPAEAEAEKVVEAPSSPVQTRNWAESREARDVAPTAAPPTSAPQRPARAEPLRSGTFVVQLGSFRSTAAARAGWQGFTGVPDLSGFSPLIATITIQRGTFHRLSIGGFNSRAEAVRTCEAIKTQGEACFVRASAGDTPLTEM